MFDVLKCHEREIKEILTRCLLIDNKHNYGHDNHLHIVLGGYNSEYYRKEISEKARANNPNARHLTARNSEKAIGFRARYISFYIDGMELKFDGYEFKI